MECFRTGSEEKSLPGRSGRMRRQGLEAEPKEISEE